MTGDDPPPVRSAPPKVKHRPSWIIFVVLGAIVCVGMGVWQLARYQEVSGTVQNLGYTFMWPFLGGFLFYAYYKYIRMEADEAADLGAADDAAGRSADGEDSASWGAATPGGTVGAESFDDEGHRRGDARSRGHARTRSRVTTEIPADILPTKNRASDQQVEDEGLRAYNTYLAELARRDAATADRSQENSHR